MKNFEILPHTADLKIRIFGNSLKELFENSIYAMFASIEPIYTDGKDIEFNVEIDSINRESLFVDFLSEALYLSDANSVAFKSASISEFSDTHLKAKLVGSSIARFEVVEIKAVTYHDLKIQKVDDSWMAEVVFDI